MKKKDEAPINRCLISHLYIGWFRLLGAAWDALQARKEDTKGSNELAKACTSLS
jgi:hypothetical protein